MGKTNISKFCSISLVALMAIAGCNGSSSPTEPSGAGASGTGADGVPLSGSLQIKMIDAPTDEICELHVYIKDLRVKPDGQPQMLLGTDIGDFDLLELQDSPPAVLGNFSIDQGLYQFVEILLDESRSYVVEKDPSDPANLNCLTTQSPLQIPSAKFKVSGGPFNVDESTSITIDFDAHKSLKIKGGGNSGDKGWQLKPDVSITNVEP